MSFQIIKYMDSLTEAGVSPKQAKAIANGMEVFTSSRLSDIPTGKDFKLLENKLTIRLYSAIAAAITILLAVGHFIIDYRIDAIDQKIETVQISTDQKIGVLDQKIEVLDQKIEVLDQKIEILDQKIGTLQASINQNQALIQKLIDK